MPFCNRADRGCNITPPRKRADFPLVWRHEETWLTDFRGRRRNVGSGNAAGAVPNRGNTVCLLQASIVKVSSGKRRWSESVRLGHCVAQLVCPGVSNSPTADREVTAHPRETVSDRLPRGGDGPLPAAAA
jgi:hypothetical protein